MPAPFEEIENISNPFESWMWTHGLRLGAWRLPHACLELI